MTIHPFDAAIQLEKSTEGNFVATTAKPYANMAGPFGGVTSASMMRAVLLDERLLGDPVSLTVNFCAAIKDGAYTISTRLVRGGKHTQHWMIEVIQNEVICNTATLITGMRRAEFSHQTASAPDIPDWTECEVLTQNMFLGWLNCYDFRYVEGPPPMPEADTGQIHPARSVMWVNDSPARPLDYFSLAAISDSFILRLLHLRRTFVPMGTVSLTTHFIASRDEIAEQGTTPLLGISEAMRFHGNFHDQHMQFFGKGGKLMASGSQLVWFRQ
ncbi:MAG: acyl-CoA thioesterase [Paracoccaceae bacterium]|jgi:acyl-CoA thioesterase